tara:strand:- start:7116 stop:7355 length:240 start_codon:yes stop_codon:yes gene_type:complete
LIQDSNFIDLKSVPCPLNVVKCKLALEKLSKEDILFVDLDRGEPEIMVKQTLENLGYQIDQVKTENEWIRLVVRYGCKS